MRNRKEYKMNKNKKDYINFHCEHESFEKSLNAQSIIRNNKRIITNVVLITIVLITILIVSILNIDIFEPLGWIGVILRYIVGGLMVWYIIIFFKIFK